MPKACTEQSPELKKSVRGKPLPEGYRLTCLLVEGHSDPHYNGTIDGDGLQKGDGHSWIDEETWTE